MAFADNSKTVKKILKKYLREYARKTKMKKITEQTYAFDCGTFIQGLTFFSNMNGFVMDIFIQPLYIPDTDYLVLDYGQRLEHFTDKHNGVWAPDEEEYLIEKDIQLAMGVIANEVQEWFDKNNSIEKITKNIETNNVKPARRGWSDYTGYGYAMLGDYEKAEKYLLEYRDTRLNFDTESDKLKRKELEEFIEIMKTDPERVPEILQGYIDYTRKGLKLDKEK